MGAQAVLALPRKSASVQPSSNLPRRHGQGNEGHEGDEEEGSDEGHEGHEEEGGDEGHEGDEEEGSDEGHEGDEEEGGDEGHEGHEEVNAIKAWCRSTAGHKAMKAMTAPGA